MQKVPTLTRSTFKAQASKIKAILNESHMLNDSEQSSLLETVGLLMWLDQLGTKIDGGAQAIPEELYNQIFKGRTPTKA